jgi:uncharacterized protein YukE
MSFITVEDGAVGRGAQNLDQRAQQIRQHLSGLVADLEHSHKSWDGESGRSFEAAKQQLFTQFDAIFTSLSRIAVGLGKSQNFVDTSDSTSATDVGTAGQELSSLSRPVNVNV